MRDLIFNLSVVRRYSLLFLHALPLNLRRANIVKCFGAASRIIFQGGIRVFPVLNFFW